MNTLTIAGRLGRDAELRYTQGGKPVLGFAVAVDKRGPGGEKGTEWVDCSLWGDRGEKLAEYLTKSKVVAVSGEAGVRAYMGKDGKPVAALTLRVIELTLLGGGSEAGERPQRQAGGAAKPAGAPAPEFDGMDVPF
jgi:single-strand DNA-binding protein